MLNHRNNGFYRYQIRSNNVFCQNMNGMAENEQNTNEDDTVMPSTNWSTPSAATKSSLTLNSKQTKRKVDSLWIVIAVSFQTFLVQWMSVLDVTVSKVTQQKLLLVDIQCFIRQERHELGPFGTNFDQKVQIWTWIPMVTLNHLDLEVKIWTLKVQILTFKLVPVQIWTVIFLFFWN